MLDAIEYLFTRLKDKRAVTHKVDGQEYAVTEEGTLGAPIRTLPPQFIAPTLEVSTLSGFVAAIKAGIDGFPTADAAIHVVDHLNVNLVSAKSDTFGHRHVWVHAKHPADTAFVFGHFYKPEAFLIAFRSSFFFNEEAVKVQQVCSTVGSGEAVLVADDGISQEVTIKSGTVTKTSFALPSDGIPLIPWRTFRDANPVQSRFLLRMKGVKDSLPEIALFEIDAKWKLDTVGSIASYLAGATTIPIIA